MFGQVIHNSQNLSQTSHSVNEVHMSTNDESFHGHIRGFRFAALIGHTLIKSEGSNSHLFIPSWGLDIEYWMNHSWGIGLHNDVEIETYVIRQSEQEDIERINPLVITLDMLYRFDNDLVLSMGPGIEYQHKESYYLVRLGLEYEKEIGGGYDISPAVFYDQRLDGFATYTVALGVGKRL